MEDTKKDKVEKDLEYDFGGIKEYNLEEIENEVVNDSIYLDVFAGSDERFKSDIKSIKDALIKVQSLNGVTYNYRKDEFPQKNFAATRQVGLIAQNVEKLLPEVVQTDSDGFKYVNYSQIVPLLIEGLKDLSTQVNDLQNEVHRLNYDVENVRRGSLITETAKSNEINPKILS